MNSVNIFWKIQAATKMIWIFTGLILLIYLPHFKFASSSISTAPLLYLLPLFLLADLHFQKTQLLAIVCLLFVVGWMVSLDLLALIRQFNIDFRGSKIAIYNLFVFLSALVIYRNIKFLNAVELLRVIHAAVGFNAILVILIFIDSEFEAIFNLLVDVNPLYFEYPIRRPTGLMYTGFSYLSSLFGIIFVFGLILVVEAWHLFGRFSKMLFIVLQAVIFTAIMVVGRSGVLVILFATLVYILVLLMKGKLSKPFYFYRLLKLIAVFISILAGGYVAVLSSDYSSYLDWAFGFITSSFQGETLTDSSVLELAENHYFLPPAEVDFLFGIGDFNFDTEVAHSYHSDVGYIKLIFGAGALSLVGVLAIAMYLLFSLYRKFHINEMLSSTILVFIVSLIILNFKDFYVFNPSAHFFILYLLILKFLDMPQAVGRK